jgi:hypothetical protein
MFFIRTGLALFLVILAPMAAAATLEPATLASDFLAARVSAGEENATPLAPGHLHLVRAKQGRRIVDGAGRPMGWLLGPTELTYDIDPADLPVVAFNVREASGLPSSVSIPPAPGKEPARTIQIVAESVAWLELSGPLGGSDQKAGNEAASPEALQKALRPLFFAPELDYAEARLRGEPNNVLVVAELGWKKRIVYSYKPDRDTENLLYVHPGGDTTLDDLGYPGIDSIDTRPIARGRRAARRIPAEVRGVDVRLAEEADEIGRGKATIDFAFLEDRPPVLRVGLHLREIAGASIARIRTIQGKVISVADSSGTPLPFAEDGRARLVVQLPKPPRRGDVLRLVFDYTTPLPRHGGYEFWDLGLSAWYPRLPDLRESWGPFRGEILALKPFTPVATGKEVKRWSTETHNGLIVEQKRSIWGPAVAAGKYYRAESTDEKGRSLQVISYAMEKPRGQKTLAKLLADSLTLYELIFPPCPFDAITVQEVPSFGFGQAPSGIIRITQESYTPGYTVTHRFFSQFANEIFAHEIAHAWWGHTFRAIDDDDQWLEESFAEYSSAVMLEMGRDKSDLDRKTARWLGQAREVPDGIPLVAANRLAGNDADTVRWRLLYNKGPWTLHCLRSEMDDKTFLTVLKSFLRSFDGKPARTEDFRGLLEFVTKKSWKEWFDRYVYGSEMPKPAEKKG